MFDQSLIEDDLVYGNSYLSNINAEIALNPKLTDLAEEGEIQDTTVLEIVPNDDDSATDPESETESDTSEDEIEEYTDIVDLVARIKHSIDGEAGSCVNNNDSDYGDEDDVRVDMAEKQREFEAILFEGVADFVLINLVIADDAPFENIGHIHSYLPNAIIVKGSVHHTPLDIDSILFLDRNTPLGMITDVLGRVSSPYYTVRVDEKQQGGVIDFIRIRENINNRSSECGDSSQVHPPIYVYYSTNCSQAIPVQQLAQLKYSDATGENDKEIPIDLQDFSDDEEARIHKQTKKNKNKPINNIRQPQKINYPPQPIALKMPPSPIPVLPSQFNPTFQLNQQQFNMNMMMMQNYIMQQQQQTGHTVPPNGLPFMPHGQHPMMFYNGMAPPLPPFPPQQGPSYYHPPSCPPAPNPNFQQ